MTKIKIAHILHAVGGVDVYLRLVTENINSEKFSTVIIHGNKEVSKKYFDSKKNEISEYILPIGREINLINDFNSIYSIVKILKKEKPNIIHAHSAKGGVLARISSLFYKVVVLHTPHAYSYLSAESSLKRHLFLRLEKIFKNFNSILLATSNSEKLRGVSEVGYKQEKALLFSNSIYPIEVIPRLSIEKTWPDNYICTIGRPSYQKNIEMMVEIIKEVKKKIPEIHLVLMGVGLVSPNTENIKRLISLYNLTSNITLIDWIEREKIFHIIEKSKFYISTARYEGLPYAIIESLALSKAIIATDVDGNRDLVKDGYNGFLINEGEEKEYVNKLIELYENNSLLATFEKNSYSLFQENYNFEKNIKILENIYIKYS